MKKTMFFISLLFIMCLGCTKNEEDKAVCSAVVHAHLIIETWAPRDSYTVNFDATNTGDKRITRIEVPCTVYFENGTSIQGSGWAIMDLAPGETVYDVEAYINPAGQNPYNPRYHWFDGNIVNSEFSDPMVTCEQ
jgi:hypothetical protein